MVARHDMAVRCQPGVLQEAILANIFEKNRISNQAKIFI